MSLRFLRILTPSLLCAFILVGPAHAQQPPVLPFSPWGTVKLNGANVPAVTEVSAWCGGVRYGGTTTIDLYQGQSWYSNFDIPGDVADMAGIKEGCYPDEIVRFKIGGVWAREKARWIPGGPGRVDLTASPDAALPHKTWLPLLLQCGPLDEAVRRVNGPYFDAAVRYSEMAVFWFGRVTPTENYADVRVGYNSQQLVLNVAAFDRRLWYDIAPSPGHLSAWDAVTLYLSLDDGAAATLGSSAYRFEGQLTWWEAPRTQWQAAYRYDGTAWSSSDLAFTTSSGWRGDAPNTEVDDRGWNLSFVIPFSSLGLSSAPAPGTDWRMALVLHDRDDASGTPIPDKTWPEALSAASPATWGTLGFGMPTYTPPVATPGGSVTIRHRLNGVTVSDAAVGGHTVCGAGTDFWTQWGGTNEAFYNPARDRFNVQNQEDISDWPCFSKYYVTFPLTGVPASKTIISSTLTLYQIGNAGEGWTPGPQPSYIQVLTVDQDWNENTLTWNNAPPAAENITGTWVDPLPAFPSWPGVPRRWDVSRAVAQAYAAGHPLRLVVYSADSPYHSGRYFTASDIGDWDEAGRPTLTITWGEPDRYARDAGIRGAENPMKSNEVYMPRSAPGRMKNVIDWYRGRP